MEVSLYGKPFASMPENLAQFRPMLVYRGAGLG